MFYVSTFVFYSILKHVTEHYSGKMDMKTIAFEIIYNTPNALLIFDLSMPEAFY